MRLNISSKPISCDFFSWCLPFTGKEILFMMCINIFYWELINIKHLFSSVFLMCPCCNFHLYIINLMFTFQFYFSKAWESEYTLILHNRVRITCWVIYIVKVSKAVEPWIISHWDTPFLEQNKKGSHVIVMLITTPQAHLTCLASSKEESRPCMENTVTSTLTDILSWNSAVGTMGIVPPCFPNFLSKLSWTDMSKW